METWASRFLFSQLIKTSSAFSVKVIVSMPGEWMESQDIKKQTFIVQNETFQLFCHTNDIGLHEWMCLGKKGARWLCVPIIWKLNEESFGMLTSEQTSLCRYSFPRLHPSRNCWMVNAKLFRRLFECVIKSIFSHFFLELVERFLAQPSMFSNNSQLLFGTTWSWAGFIGFVILLQTFRRAPIVATNRRRTWRFSFFSRPQCLIRGC